MVILGLGSNIGDRLAQLQEAVRALAPIMQELRLSRVLESQAVLPDGAPPEWNKPYLNMAVCGTTRLAPQALLHRLKTLENTMGRAVRGVWGPREIDMDILAMDGVIMATPELAIPHCELLNRDFALLPLVDIAPDWIYPTGVYKGWRAADIATDKKYALSEHLRDTGLVIHV